MVASHFGALSDPLGYGKTPSRFSDPRVALPEEERFGVFYLGASIRVCFLETILRDRRTARTGYLPIPQIGRAHV